MAKLRINGDSSGYVDLEAPNAASSSTLDLDQVPQKNAANTFTQNQLISGGDAITQEIRSSGNQAHFRMVSDLNNSSWMISNESNANRLRIMHTDTGTSTNVFPLYLYEAGYVTMPHQPCVWVTGTGDYVAMNNELMRFTVINHQTGGSNYNTSSKLFTCPVAGWYECSVHALTQSSQNSEFQLKKNGTTVARRYESSGRGISAHNVVYCSANDTLGWFWASTGSVHYQGGVDAYSSGLYRLVG